MIETRGRWLLPGFLLVVGLSLLAAWMLRVLAPPSLVRDGKRLPVGLASQHAASHDHGSAAAASPVIEEPVPHFAGGLFLSLHLLALVLVAGVPLIRRLLARLRLHQNRFVAQLLFATLAALAAGTAVVVAARFGYGDRVAFGDALAGAAEVARYAFVVAIAVAVVFGVPWGATPPRRYRGSIQQVRSGT
jgi:hypothetical protein